MRCMGNFINGAFIGAVGFAIMYTLINIGVSYYYKCKSKLKSRQRRIDKLENSLDSFIASYQFDKKLCDQDLDRIDSELSKLEYSKIKKN